MYLFEGRAKGGAGASVRRLRKGEGQEGEGSQEGRAQAQDGRLQGASGKDHRHQGADDSISKSVPNPSACFSSVAMNRNAIAYQDMLYIARQARWCLSESPGRVCQVDTPWRKAMVKLEGENEYEALDKLDRLEVFQDYIL